MREIVLDTETTGLDPTNGDRLIEIGCIELFNRIPTGREFHHYINPQREVPPEAQAVHGITTDFLKDGCPYDSLDPICSLRDNNDKINSISYFISHHIPECKYIDITLDDLKDMIKIKGIGKGTITRIKEIIETGKLEEVKITDEDKKYFSTSR